MSLHKKKLKSQRPSLEVATSSSVRNAANTLLTNIRFSSVDDPVKTILIASSVPNEGKTTTAIALACAISESGKSCLLVEGDMRRRSLRSALDAKPRYGLYAVLSEECTARDAVIETSFKNVFFLDAEPGIPNPEEVLISNRYAALLEELRDAFDYVIVDAPPIGAYADASVIASKVDGTVLVVREGYTDKREALYAVESLKAAGAHILGIAFNCQSAVSGSGSGYYYGYYYEEMRVSKDSPEAQAAVVQNTAR